MSRRRARRYPTLTADQKPTAPSPTNSPTVASKMLAMPRDPRCPHGSLMAVHICDPGPPYPSAPLARSHTAAERPMTTPSDSEPFGQKLLRHYRSMQSLEGDERLRQMLSAEREVTMQDHQMTEKSRANLLAALDTIERELVG